MILCPAVQGGCHLHRDLSKLLISIVMCHWWFWTEKLRQCKWSIGLQTCRLHLSTTLVAPLIIEIIGLWSYSILTHKQNKLECLYSARFFQAYSSLMYRQNKLECLSASCFTDQSNICDLCWSLPECSNRLYSHIFISLKKNCHGKTL